MNPKISVIVPVYGVEKYLEKCLDNLLLQTYKNLEIILVDDGSPDNSGKIADEYAKKDSRIQVIHKENGGLSDARNAGMEIATGDYLAFLDSDDINHLSQYEVLLNLCMKNDADIAFCELERFTEDQTDSILEKSKIKQEGEKNILTKTEALKMMYQNGNVGNYVHIKLFKKELWEGIWFPKGRVYEDAATTYLVVDRAKRIAYTSQKLYYYLVGRTNAITTSFSEKKIQDSLDAYYHQYLFMKKHYPELQEEASVTWVKMYTSAMEKICINQYDAMLQAPEVTEKFKDFQKAFSSLKLQDLTRHLESYRVISASLLKDGIENYAYYAKELYEKIKNQ